VCSASPPPRRLLAWTRRHGEHHPITSSHPIEAYSSSLALNMDKAGIRDRQTRIKNQQDRGKVPLTGHGLIDNLKPLLFLGQHRIQLGDSLPPGLSLPLKKAQAACSAPSASCSELRANRAVVSCWLATVVRSRSSSSDARAASNSRVSSSTCHHAVVSYPSRACSSRRNWDLFNEIPSKALKSKKSRISKENCLPAEKRNHKDLPEQSLAARRTPSAERA
jgi:hypothetical protein